MRIVCSELLSDLIVVVSDGDVLSSCCVSFHAFWFVYRSKFANVWPVPAEMIGRWKMPFQYVHGLSLIW